MLLTLRVCAARKSKIILLSFVNSYLHQRQQTIFQSITKYKFLDKVFRQKNNIYFL